MTKSLLAMLVLSTVAPALAQTRPNAQANARFGALRVDGGPYRSLFQPITPATPAEPPATPKVVCGMTVIPADPKVDPKMRLEKKADGVDYKLRVIEPPICTPAR